MRAQETPQTRHRILIGAAAGAFAVAAALVSAPPAGAQDAIEAAPAYGANQIAAIETVDAALGPGSERALTHPDAAFIKARFDRVALGPRDALVVTGADGTESHRYGAADIIDGAIRALSVEGDTAVVELHDDPSDGVAAEARIAAYARGLNETELEARLPEREAESVCGEDDSVHAVCYRESDPEAYDASKSVARIIIDDQFYCTAWLVESGNRLLTNNHCLATSAEAKVTEVQFGYECLECSGGATAKPVKVTGAKVLATNYTYDYTLFTVAEYDRIAHLPHLKIDRGQAATGEKVFIPGHPGGRPMRIAAVSDEGSHSGSGTAQCRISDNAWTARGWHSDLAYLCDTEGGSSGSPVVSRDSGKVVGLHHLGGCPNSAVRMDLIYPLIAPYLRYDF
ncbi:serine protease [Glycomyces sp. NRRL B-16210]|uniref:trypsin-like serine peptidase n=1 Tax=Glycomyces sp. NRRL B-16210 TaxID=1463821 RepID=UPI000A93CE0E|nr:serine protease [Glycomyces sp. NRRL B-16210]